MQYRYTMDSCLLPNTTRFGTVDVFEIIREEYESLSEPDEITFAEIVFQIKLNFIWNWLIKTQRRKGIAI